MMRRHFKFQKNSAPIKLLLLFQILIGILLLYPQNSTSQTSDPKLAELRNQFAISYLKPESHFALAQYYLDKGNNEMAFYIMEYARRHRFRKEEFDSAFVKFFGDNTPEPTDAAKDAFEKAYDFLKADKIDDAERLFLKAAELAPKSGMINGWVGRFFYKVKNDNVNALKYYFISYFLDPHAYETEYVEYRIHAISGLNAETRIAELLKSGKSLTEISTDSNPLIVMLALQEMAKTWKKEFTTPFLNCLENDDSVVRWGAFVTVIKGKDANVEETISLLLKSNDLRQRGLAAYAIVEFWKAKSFETISKMLKENVELVRFDAVSALIQEGGKAGLEIVKEHRKSEKSEHLKFLIDREFSKRK